MTLIIACDCGTSLREESEEALVRAAEEHIRVAHPAVAGAAERDDLLAMARREAEET